MQARPAKLAEATEGDPGRLRLPEEQPAGEVRLSSYGVSTVLTCPPNARTLHLGFFAFDTANAAAQHSFVASVAQEQRVLRTVMINLDGKERR
jgi:hypothetical protein